MLNISVKRSKYAHARQNIEIEIPKFANDPGWLKFNVKMNCTRQASSSNLQECIDAPNEIHVRYVFLRRLREWWDKNFTVDVTTINKPRRRNAKTRWTKDEGWNFSEKWS